MTVVGKKNKSYNLNNLFKKIWDEFVYSGNLLALGDSLVIISLSIILGIQITWALPTVVYLSVMAINSYNRYVEYEKDILTNPERSEKIRKYIRSLPYLIVFLLATSTTIVFMTTTIQALVFMFFLFVLGIFYTIFFKGWTKKVIGFKNFLIALPYSLMVVFMALYYNNKISIAVVLVAIFYYGRIFLSAMYFDIKDIDGDAKEDLKTFAVVFGKGRTTVILQVINIISFLPLLIAIFLGLIPLYSIGLILSIPYTMYYVNKIKDLKSDKSFLYNVVADGEFLFWLPYVLIVKVLL